MPSFTSLAEEILLHAKALDEHISTRGIRFPSFDHDILTDLPPELASTRNALLDSTHEMKQLAQGPIGTTCDVLFNVRSSSVCSDLF